MAPGAKAAYALEILTVPASANPRLAAVAAAVRDAWVALGFDATLVEVKAADLATRLRAGDFTAAVVDIAEGLEPDLYPLLATSQVRAVGHEPRRLPGPGARPPPRGRPEARHAGGADGRVEGAAGRAGARASPSCRSPGTTR